jgi:hypothetical protein
MNKKLYIAAIGPEENRLLYNAVANLSPDPKHIPVYRGGYVTATGYIDTYSIIVSEEDLVMLKLRFKTLRTKCHPT